MMRTAYSFYGGNDCYNDLNQLKIQITQGEEVRRNLLKLFVLMPDIQVWKTLRLS